MINVNIRKSGGKKAHAGGKKSSALNISGGVADWLTHTRARSHMYTLQMYSRRIKLEVIFFPLSLSLIKKEGDQI